MIWHTFLNKTIDQLDYVDCTLMKMIENNIAGKGLRFWFVIGKKFDWLLLVIIFQTKLSLSAQPDSQSIAPLVFCHVVFELLFFLIGHKYAWFYSQVQDNNIWLIKTFSDVLHFIAHPVHFLYVWKYHFRINSIITNHSGHVFCC